MDRWHQEGSGWMTIECRGQSTVALGGVMSSSGLLLADDDNDHIEYGYAGMFIKLLCVMYFCLNAQG